MRALIWPQLYFAAQVGTDFDIALWLATINYLGRALRRCSVRATNVNLPAFAGYCSFCQSDSMRIVQRERCPDTSEYFRSVVRRHRLSGSLDGRITLPNLIRQQNYFVDGLDDTIFCH